MPAYRRAYLFVIRKKGKTALLLVTFLVIMTLLLAGMAVNRAAKTAAAQLRESIGGYFKIAPDYQKMIIRQFTDRQLIDQVMETEGIKAYNAMDTWYLSVPELTLKPGKFTGEGDGKAQMTRLLGNNDSSLHEYFVLNIFTLEEGRHLRPDDTGQALISRELAQMNQLKAGDTFTAYITEDGNVTGEAAGAGASEDGYRLKIAGIFDEMHTEAGNQNTPECDLPANFIFIDAATSQDIGRKRQGTSQRYFNGGAAFFARDPKELDRIVQEVQRLDGVDWDSLKLTVNNTAYQKSVEALDRLSGMTFLMVGLITVISVSLLSLLLTLWERDRIHEAGVLMAFGISKRNILWQHFLECGLIFALAFCLAAAVSFPLSRQAGKVLYHDAAGEAKENTEAVSYTFTNDPVDVDAAAPEVNFGAKLRLPALALSGVMGIVIVGISVGISFLVIVRRKPKELLTVME